VARLVIVDDHPAFRQAIAFLLDREPDFEVVAQAGSLSECRNLEGLDRLDAALVDLNLPDGDGEEFVRWLRAANPKVRVIVLTAVSDPSRLDRAKAVGADAVLSKARIAGEIAQAIRHPEAE
jgi:DNA-binding NarL/FixJ family response regulator